MSIMTYGIYSFMSNTCNFTKSYLSITIMKWKTVKLKELSNWLLLGGNINN